MPRTATTKTVETRSDERRLILIIPAAKAEAARTWICDNMGQTGMPLSGSLQSGTGDNDPVTHYELNWLMSSADYDRITTHFQAAEWSAVIEEGMANLDAPTSGKKDAEQVRNENNLRPKKTTD